MVRKDFPNLSRFLQKPTALICQNQNLRSIIAAFGSLFLPEGNFIFPNSKNVVLKLKNVQLKGLVSVFLQDNNNNLALRSKKLIFYDVFYFGVFEPLHRMGRAYLQMYCIKANSCVCVIIQLSVLG